jgi:hypothetical protein
MTELHIRVDEALETHSTFDWSIVDDLLTCRYCHWSKYFGEIPDRSEIDRAARKHRIKAALADLPLRIEGLDHPDIGP